jgi:hypothetical protein
MGANYLFYWVSNRFFNRWSDDPLLLLHTARLADVESQSDAAVLWQKPQYANPVRYVPSGAYVARMRVKGKLICKRLTTVSEACPPA